MLGQLKFRSDLRVLDKVESAIERLKAFEPKDGYFVAFSGGKDSQCVYHLCEMAGVKFDAHYSVTSVDPPELIRFIKKNYPDVIFDYPRYEDGKVITMWNLIPRKLMPPTQLARYCCEHLKESNGKGRVTVTGVRWAESVRRAKRHGVVTVIGANKQTQKIADEVGAEYKVDSRGGIILNDDNSEARRMVEHCYRTRKTLVNPLVDWEEDDVWEFLNSNHIEHCCLYDKGYKRIGCIGCPMNSKRKEELEKYPIYKQNYIRAFDRMNQKRLEKGLPAFEGDGEAVMKWWIRESE